MKTNFFFFLVVLAFKTFAQGQGDFSIPNYAAKSPEAASFLKYGEYPVDLSTGVPTINVPLYSIDIKGISIPINLKYHASGLKVTDEASWVGLGWTLNFGAQVIRNVKDAVDEENGMINDIPSDASMSYYDAHPYAFNSGPIVNEQWDKSRVKDEYHFSSPTASGTFVTGSDGITVFPPEAFKVSYAQGGGFKIIDKSGITYYLTVQEISRRQTQGSSNYTSAWYVSKIETPNNDVINFNYVDDGELVENFTVQNQGILESYTNCGCNSGATISKSLTPVSTLTIKTITQSKKIDNITFNNGKSKIVFVRTGGREDLINNNSRLSSLEVRHWNGTSYALQRGFALNYTYFNNSATGSLAYKQKRLKLTAVETLLEGDAYQFTYSNTALPAKDSYSQDYYGFYNGRNNPDMIVQKTSGIYTFGNGDRRVDASYNQAGMLSKVYYPTKGWTEFTYETNTYWGINPFAEDELETVSFGIVGKGAAQSIPPDDTIPENAEGPSSPYETLCETCIQYSVYSIAGSGTVNAGIWTNPNQSQLHLKYQYGRVRIFDANWVEKYSSGKSNKQQFINPSQYVSDAAFLVVEAYGQDIHVTSNYSYNPGPAQPENVLAGGLRVKSIKNFDINNQLLLQKDYNYAKTEDPLKSSGALTNYLFTSYESWDPVTYELATCTGGSNQTSAYFTRKYVVSSVSRGRTEGNTVAYQYVKEEMKNSKDASQNGYTLYKFTTSGNPLSEIPEINYRASWKVGSLLEKTIYAIKNGMELPIRKEINVYTESENAVAQIPGFKMVRKATVPVNEDPSNPLQIPVILLDSQCGFLPQTVYAAVTFYKYNYIIPQYYLQSTQVIESSYGSGNQLLGTLSRVTSYSYNNPIHLQLTSEVTKSSTGETIEQRYYYPGDTELAAEPAITELISRNMLSPLKVQTYRNDVKLSERLTRYRSWGNNILAPELILSAKGSAPLENRIRFNSYDLTHGNPTELQKETGTKVSYIWAYDKSRPVAKIENMGYSNIPQSLIQEIQYVADTGTENDLQIKLDGLRNDPVMASAMVETYTYRPLGGISVTKDVRGNKKTYTYDNQERLTEVRDQDNMLITENKYHFKD